MNTAEEAQAAIAGLKRAEKASLLHHLVRELGVSEAAKDAAEKTAEAASATLAFEQAAKAAVRAPRCWSCRARTASGRGWARASACSASRPT